MSELKACPCGCADPRLPPDWRSTPSLEGHLYAVECSECGMRTAWCRSKEAAASRWNRRALEAAEAAAWQPIETAPRDAGSEVLLNVPPFAPMQGVRRSDGSWMVGARSIIGTALRAGMEPTHWRPLPAPPEETPDAR